ncbi:MAG: acetylglutamate kinase, partial [Planctomycetes bacterium]|nr:acetylglutamate kinase [Planctomycetota bacterium]
MNFLGGNNSKAPLIVKLGGSALDDPDARVELWRALRELHASLAGGLVLVHGGGGAVDRHLSRLGWTTERIDG